MPFPGWEAQKGHAYKQRGDGAVTETAALRALQQVDLEIHRWEIRLEQLEERHRVQQSQKKVQACRRAWEEAESTLQGGRRRLRHLEASLEELELELERLQQKLFSGTGGEGPRELTGLQARSADRQTQKLGVEEEIMVLWDTLEEAERQVEKRRAAFKENEEILQGHLRNLEQQEKQLRAEMERLQERRRELVQEVPPSWLRVYQKLGEEKTGAVVVGHSEGRCLGCRVTLPSRVLRQGETHSLRHCPHCGRILLDRDNPDDQGQEG